jgi:hypothetical protein
VDGFSWGFDRDGEEEIRSNTIRCFQIPGSIQQRGVLLYDVYYISQYIYIEQWWFRYIMLQKHRKRCPLTSIEVTLDSTQGAVVLSTT